MANAATQAASDKASFTKPRFKLIRLETRRIPRMAKSAQFIVELMDYHVTVAGTKAYSDIRTLGHRSGYAKGKRM
ncbi:hypothetical protein NBRC116493_33350 [Aurantivibrio infirmus]